MRSKDDFAFEREIYSIAYGFRLQPEHAGLYEDPVTNKPRQFDIRCHATIKTQRIALAIECKRLNPTYPLLASCVPRATNEAQHQILHTDAVMGNGASFTRVQTVAGGRYPLLYPPREGVCKSMQQARREVKGERRGEMVGGDEVFDKWMQALASMADLIERGAEALSVRREDGVTQMAFLPVLAVPDGTLWVANYSTQGDLREEPFQAEEITFFLGRKYSLTREKLTFAIAHLHVMTRTAVGNFLQNIADGGGIWQQLFQS